MPADVKAKSGGTTYDNFDTNRDVMYDYTPDAAADVPAIVTGNYGAGRMQHGDFTWTFNNATEDANDGIITALKTALQNYQPTLMGHFGDNTGIRQTVNSQSVYQPSFDLGGRRVATPRKGSIYISNGHKHLSR